MPVRTAVLGMPVRHSLSPVLHRAGFAALGLTEWTYDAIEVAEADLMAFVDGLGAEWAGLSLTMPLKAAALTAASEASPLARLLGVANTLVLRNGRRFAENTDAPGAVAALYSVGCRDAQEIAILGAGGTARAALAVASALGARATVYARRPMAVAELLPLAAILEVPLTPAHWDDVADAVRADVVFSTVPAGAAATLGHLEPRPNSVVFDVLYDPWPTPLAAVAIKAGCRLVTGLDLLAEQAYGQFELFTGLPAPRRDMRAALDEAVAERRFARDSPL
ncbi:MAG: shikimate dehydrogenase [Longispora sp.]|nr:shikimate dehydrogenase [Longispora sp. (in: high G+C Gram-positive bacteria)]